MHLRIDRRKAKKTDCQTSIPCAYSLLTILLAMHANWRAGEGAAHRRAG